MFFSTNKKLQTKYLESHRQLFSYMNKHLGGNTHTLASSPKDLPCMENKQELSSLVFHIYL